MNQIIRNSLKYCIIFNLLCQITSCKKDPIKADFTLEKTSFQISEYIEVKDCSVNAHWCDYYIDGKFYKGDSHIFNFTLQFDTISTHIIKCIAYSKNFKHSDEMSKTITIVQ